MLTGPPKKRTLWISKWVAVVILCITAFLYFIGGSSSSARQKYKYVLSSNHNHVLTTENVVAGPRPNVIYMAVGDHSVFSNNLIPSWITANRTFDLAIMYYGHNTQNAD